jgi:hypothetical protein
MSRFTADCSHCCGLCCIVPAYLEVQGFPFDKAAETPCRHLGATARCSVHGERSERGFGGCIGFDCHGAGQWVTAQFGGVSWTDPSAARSAMSEAYRRWLPRFKIAALLEAALPLVGESHQPLLRQRIEEVLDPGHESTAADRDGALAMREALRFVRSLLPPR